MKQRHGASASLPSTPRLFFTVVAIVFLAEAATMTLLRAPLPGAHLLAMSIADASIPVILSVPFLWWFVVRPLRSTAVREHRRAEAQRMASIQLETTIEARTRELQTANLRLEEASRHKSEFLANTCHEFRTPLNSILGFSRLLQDPTQGSLNEKQTRYAQNILVGGQHLLDLINDLLDLSKVEAGKLELQPETFSLPDAIKAAFRIIWPQAEAKQQVLELQVADDLSIIRADMGRFERILCNLLSNAVKFTPDAGRITVTAQRRARGEGPEVHDGSPLDPTPYALQSDEFVELAVQDTGIGIRSEDLPKLFQSFTQIKHTFATRYRGTGLGLFLTKQLVELHGGMIWAESAGEGQGSTFTIRLPLGPPGEAWEASTVNPSQVGG